MADAAPGRIIPGLELLGRGVDVSPAALRDRHRLGNVAVLAEVSSQYAGIAPNDPRSELPASVIVSAKW